MGRGATISRKERGAPLERNIKIILTLTEGDDGFYLRPFSLPYFKPHVTLALVTHPSSFGIRRRGYDKGKVWLPCLERFQVLCFQNFLRFQIVPHWLVLKCVIKQ